MAQATAAAVPRLLIAEGSPSVRWFAPYGSVEERDGMRHVLVGGMLVGQFDPSDRDRGPRNIYAVTLAKEPTMHLGRLAAAFGIGEEYLRRLRRLEAARGLGAVLKSAVGGRWRITDAKRDELHGLFAAGATVSEATRRQQRGKGRVSRPTVSREWQRWAAHRDGAKLAAPVAAAISAIASEQLALCFSTAALAAMPGELNSPAADPETANADAMASTDQAGAVAVDEDVGATIVLGTRPVIGGAVVQHVGTWMMMALAARDGLHDEIAALGGADDATRVAVDATLASLAIGEHTVEGVRRVATPTAAKLLRADRAPAATTVRSRLWQFAKAHAADLMAAMSQRYLDAARRGADEPAVFYIDGHLRQYTGKHTVRKGWRMQDRRAVPGTSDYYVHDEDGRPLFRVAVPSHDSLTQWLPQIATRLRDALGPSEQIVLAFDRAGSFPEELAGLRDAGFDFVAYERKPYALVAGGAFDRTIAIRGEVYRLGELRRKNLGKARGRVRRILLGAPDGAQINVLAVSTLPAERLVGILLGREADDDPSGRWQQENGFKHGVERWGINQLDGRKVEPVPPGTIIPNPRRRRIERALAIARTDEGRARVALSKLPPSGADKRRAQVEADLEDAIWRRIHLEMMRPLVPKHAPVEDTDLAGKLVRHTGQLKLVVDTIRIVCANVESDLAEWIAPHLRKPREAKKVIANLFAAPGRVDVAAAEIRVRLAPPANRSERVAIRRLLEHVTSMRLTLPGDAHRRPLRFEAQLS
jgi:hypothetical protein